MTDIHRNVIRVGSNYRKTLFQIQERLLLEWMKTETIREWTG